MTHPVETLRMAVLPLKSAVSYIRLFLPGTMLGAAIDIRHGCEVFPLYRCGWKLRLLFQFLFLSSVLKIEIRSSAEPLFTCEIMSFCPSSSAW
jgi:hypothetical protein